MGDSPTPTPRSLAAPGTRAVAAARAQACLALSLVAAGLLPVGPIRFFLFGTLSGAPLLLALKRRWRPTELVCASCAMSLVAWSAATPLLWILGAGDLLRWWPAAIALLLAAGESRRPGRLLLVRGDAVDAFALGLMALGAIPILAVRHANGFVLQDGLVYFAARAWYRFDSFYLFALIQEAIERHSYPPINPFLPGLANHYPSAFHCGLAGLILQGGNVAAYVLPSWTPLFLLPNLGLLAHAVSRRAPRHLHPLARLALAFATLVFVVLRIDLFIYPQTVAFAMTGLFLLVSLLVGRGLRTSPALFAAAWCVAGVLIGGHAITSAAALVLLFFEFGPAALREAPRRPARALFVGAVFVGAAAFYHAMNHLPQSYPWSLDPARLRVDWSFAFSSIRPWIGPLIVILAACVWAWRRRRPTAGYRLILPPLVLIAAGLAYLAWGLVQLDPDAQWFIVFNSERFLHLALFAALPLVARLGRAGLWAAVLLLAASFVIEPTWTSKTAHLLVSEEEAFYLDGFDIEMLDTIRDTTPVDSRFFCDRFFSIVGAFTGRPQYTAEPKNHWAFGSISSEAYGNINDSLFGFVSGFTPAQRRGMLGYLGVTHLLFVHKLQAPESELDAWVRALLGPGFAHVEAYNERWVLLRVAARR